jgi:hypothetical protein
MEEVRAPIEYKYERMVETRRPRGRPRRVTRASIKEDENEITEGIMNLDIENAMRQSMIEFQEKILIDERKRQEEEQIKRENRINILSKFRNILHQLKRISTYDKDIQALNLILGPIIELYCESTGQPILVNKEIYDMIIKNIRTIRLSKEELNLINEIIYV